ncbi:hypothetical protein [Clostridium sp.]|uniref:hypothetical protein n=1 Tax=Clostridium sp. TaxID=1506 RepID=UPI00257F22FF|nr:hypothetical protein [Clostridium sp.]
MIKNFKKGSYRMSAAAVICCVLAGGIVFTSNVTAKNNSIVTKVNNKESINKQQGNRFLIDARVKYYGDLEKAEKVSGFKFKVPDSIPANYGVGDIAVRKVSDKVNMLEILFTENRGDKSFRFLASKGNIEDVLKQNAQQMYKDGKVEISKEAKSLSGINGFNITVKNTGAQKQTAKFFVWKNEGVWYGIETEIKYNKYFSDGEGQVHMNGIGINNVDNVGKIVSSIKTAEDIKNVNYSVNDDRYKLFVYDNEDLKKAEELLEFTPKLPLNIGKDIAIEDSTVESLGNLSCQFNVFYRFKGVNPIHFTQSKNSDIYKDLKKKGYVEVKDAAGKIQHKKAQTLKIGNKEIYKYETSSEDAINEKEKVENYIWKESNFYCKVSISSFDDSQTQNPENQDEIAKKFVNSKSIN